MLDPVITSYKVDFRIENISRDKEKYSIMTNKSVYQEDNK